MKIQILNGGYFLKSKFADKVNSNTYLFLNRSFSLISIS